MQFLIISHCFVVPAGAWWSDPKAEGGGSKGSEEASRAAGGGNNPAGWTERASGTSEPAQGGTEAAAGRQGGRARAGQKSLQASTPA